jgi:hypothetical protein
MVDFLGMTRVGRSVALNVSSSSLHPESPVSEKFQPNAVANPNPPQVAEIDRAAGARILARSFYRELRASGYTPKQLLSISTELIDLITQDLQQERKGAA